jgi:hypothetical protein
MLRNFACSIFLICFDVLDLIHILMIFDFFLDHFIKILLFLILLFNPNLYCIFFYFGLYCFDFCPFINVFIIFNLTLKLKIYCYPLIYFYDFNPHSFYCYFLFWISCIVFLCNFNPYNFFMYITPSLVTWIII